MPGMRGNAAGARRGRRGRRTAPMIRAAQERITVLFTLAEEESRGAPSPYPDRYLRLARRIGMRYNLRVPPEFRSLYCRRCSTYWVEGRTVRTRLRGGKRTQTCLKCGAVRRVLLRAPRPPVSEPEDRDRVIGAPQQPALIELEEETEDVGGEEEG